MSSKERRMGDLSSIYPRARWLLLALALVAIAFVTLGDLRHHDWAFDDIDYIDNAARTQDDFFYVFSPDKLWAARPTVHLFFWSLYPLCQTDPGAYHLANLIVHALNAWLCAALVYRWCRHFSSSAGAALFFLFHLGTFRAVYWIAGASLTLASFFSLLALLAALFFLHSQKKSYYAGALLAFTLAIFAHSAAISILAPLAITLLKLGDIRRRFNYLAPFGLVAIAALSINFFYYPTPLNEASEFAIGSHAIANYFHMLFRLFSGAHYDVSLPAIPANIQIGLGIFMTIALLLFAYKKTSLRGGVAWSLATIAPFALWPDGANIWRYYYLASAGSCFLQAALLAHIAERAARTAPRIRHLGGTVFVGCALALSSISIAAIDARQAVQYGFSGLYFAKSKRYEQALPQYDKALALDPDNALTMSWRYHQAICQFKTGQTLVAYANMIDIVPALAERDDIYAWLIQAHAALYQMEGIELGENDSFTLYTEGQNAFRADALRSFREGKFRKSRSLSLAYLHYFPEDRELASVLAQSQAALRATSNQF